jgi:hypothetical protein
MGSSDMLSPFGVNESSGWERPRIPVARDVKQVDAMLSNAGLHSRTRGRASWAGVRHSLSYLLSTSEVRSVTSLAPGCSSVALQQLAFCGQQIYLTCCDQRSSPQTSALMSLLLTSFSSLSPRALQCGFRRFLGCSLVVLRDPLPDLLS